MKQDLEQKLLQSLLEQDSSQQASLLHSLSGGPDSVAMAYALWRLKQTQQWHGQVYLAHFYHPFSADEELDRNMQDLCRELAAQLQLPLLEGEFPTWQEWQKRKNSLEALGRQKRYQFLTEIAQKYNIPFVLTAHHRQDLAETLFLNLLRGTGLRGLQGIRLVRPLAPGVSLLRPWLDVDKQEILAYVHHHNLPYIHDKLNDNLYFLRNFLRHEVLPLLRKRNPLFDKKLAHLATQTQWYIDWVEQEANPFYEHIWQDPFGGWHLPPSLWQAARPVVAELIRTLFSHLHIPLRFEKILALFSFASTPTSQKLDLGGHYLASWEKGEVVVHPQLPPPSLEAQQLPQLGKYTITEGLEVILEQIPFQEFLQQRKTRKNSFPWSSQFFLYNPQFPLTLRNYRAGERYQPLGAPGRKKLKKIWQERHIPSRMRPYLLLFEDCNSNILAAEGADIAHQVRVPENCSASASVITLHIRRTATPASLKEAVIT